MYKITNMNMKNRFQDPFIGIAIGPARVHGPQSVTIEDSEFEKSQTLKMELRKRLSGKKYFVLVEKIQDEPKKKVASSKATDGQKE